jgi:hypothetical protein
MRRVSELTGQTSRTINDHLDVVSNALHFVTYFLNLAVYDFDFLTDAVCDPRDIRMRHPSLLRQPVQFLESILQICQSYPFPQELFCALFSEDSYHTQPIGNPLADPRFSSFVAIPNILRISTSICVIMSVIAVVGDTFV